MRPTMVLWFVLAIGIGWFRGEICVGEQQRPPNIVVFLSDDQGWGDLSLHGNSQLQTPNIDSLARDGARFDRFFVCPVCAPTRAEFLTGRYHPRGGVSGVSTGQERLDLDEQTLADILSGAGYATGAFGKWHNGSQWPYHPNARGFQEYYGFTSGHWGEYFDPPLEHNGKFVRGKGFITDDLTEHALAFIEQNRQRPFFCYVPFNTPHSPFAVPEEYWQKHKDQPITMRGKDGDNETVDVTRCVLAMCENIDWNVGRVLRRLDELGLRENTIVIYFADNGPNSFRWNGGMKGRKGSTDEGGVRVPCLLRFPRKIQGGVVVKEIAGAIDLMPTLVNLAGIAADFSHPLDGKDVTPLLMGDRTAWPDRQIFSHWAGRTSVRTQRYRLDDQGGLYDMQVDPAQTTNIAAAQPEVTRELSQAVAAWRRDVGLPSVAAGPPANRKQASDKKVNDKKGKAKQQRGNIPDERPFPVGFAEFPLTPLPARDGEPHGGVQRSSNAPNCSYFVNWTNRDDSMTWDIEVHTAGDYEAAVYFTCPEADAGATVELVCGDGRTSAKVPAWDPPLYTNQDTIPRPPAESQMKPFRPLPLGTLRLERGRGVLTLRASEIPGKTVMDVRMVTLTLKKE